MNAVSKVLRIVAILGAVAAGVFFYLTQNKVKELDADLTTTKDAAANAATKAKADLDAANTKADTLDATNRKLATDLRNALEEAEGQKSLRAETAAQLTTIQTQLRTRDATITDLQSRVAAAGASQGNVQDLQNQIAGFKNENARLQEAIKKLETEGPATKAKVDPAKPGVVLEGPSQAVTILSVDPKFGLVLLNVGTDKKVGEGNIFQLQKDKAVLGTVVVSESHPDFSIATVTATGNLSSSDFYKQVKKGSTFDAVQAQ